MESAQTNMIYDYRETLYPIKGFACMKALQVKLKKPVVWARTIEQGVWFRSVDFGSLRQLVAVFHKLSDKFLPMVGMGPFVCKIH